MATFVIKSWHASNTPDSKGNFITITGRRQGILSWLFSIIGLDPTVTIMVNQLRIEFASASLSGSIRALIPLTGVCSTRYGFQKPWKQALSLFITLMFLFFPICTAVGERGDFPAVGFLVGFIIILIIVLAYYFMNQKLMLAFVENSGYSCGIEFKRSVIENVSINEEQAGYVCQLIQFLIENKPQVK